MKTTQTVQNFNIYNFSKGLMRKGRDAFKPELFSKVQPTGLGCRDSLALPLPSQPEEGNFSLKPCSSTTVPHHTCSCSEPSVPSSGTRRWVRPGGEPAGHLAGDPSPGSSHILRECFGGTVCPLPCSCLGLGCCPSV